MLSRVAESIYWMARYIERAENIARFIDVNLNMALDMPDPQAAQWEPLIAATGDIEIFGELYGEMTRDRVVNFLTFDPAYPNSILSCVRMARENARSIREVISSDLWEAINTFYLTVNQAAQSNIINDSPHEFFAEVKKSCHVYEGLGASTMSHGEGWSFSRLGQKIERADKTSRILDVKYFYLLPKIADVGAAVDVIQWSAVLRSVSGLEAYRQIHHRIVPQSVIEFLMLDRDFPRSIHYCLIRAEESLRRLSGSSPGTFSNAAEQRLGRLRSQIAYAQVQDIIAIGLHEYIDGLQAQLNLTGSAIYDRFFAVQPIPGGQGQDQ